MIFHYVAYALLAYKCTDKRAQTHVKGGHFLDEDVGAFDAAFFNYSAEMAQVVDPQFRLQLESTYEALENGRLPLLRLYRVL